MADTFQLEVATPEREVVNEQVSEAELPGRNGYFGVLPGHAPLLSALDPGVLTYGTGGSKHVLAIDSGFVEVFDNHVRVLADNAELASEIHVEGARRELEKQTEALRRAQDEAAADSAELAIKRAQARIDAAQRVSGGAESH